MELKLGGGRGTKNAAYPRRNDRENNVLCGSGGAVIVFSRRRSRLNNCNDTKQDRRGETRANCPEWCTTRARRNAGLNRHGYEEGGMARRQGGSFNSILGREEIASLSASPSSEQQRATGKQLARRREGKHTIKKNVCELTFLVLGCPTAPGCLCLWGTLFCVGGRPPSLSFFLAISSVRSSRPRPSRAPTTLLLLNPTTQPSLVRGEKAGLEMTDAACGQ